MPEAAEDPFTPMANPPEPSSDGVLRSAGDIAAEAARSAIGGEVTPPPALPGPSATNPGSTFAPTEYGSPEAPLLSPEAQHASLQGTEPVVIDPEVVAAVAEATTPTSTPTEIPGEPLAFTVEDYKSLQDMGVNLPVSPEDVPKEFLGIYAEMAQNAMDSFHNNQQNTLDAQEAILRVKDFTDRLGTPEGQQRMLLGMALNSPDVFTQAMDTVNRMKEDPEYSNSIRRGLEADVKMEAAVRKEAAIDATALQNKGRQIESRTVRLATRLGIDAQVAKDLVAHRIMSNETNYGKRDITFEEVDQILQSLATRSKTRVPEPVAAPATQVQVAQAPATPGQAPGQTPPAEDPATQGLYKTPAGVTGHVEDRLRAAVLESSTRIKATGL